MKKQLGLLALLTALFVLTAAIRLAGTVYKSVNKVALMTFGKPETGEPIMDTLFRENTDQEFTLRRFVKELDMELRKKGVMVNLPKKVNPDYFLFEFYMLLMPNIYANILKKILCRLRTHSPGEIEKIRTVGNGSSYRRSCFRCGRKETLIGRPTSLISANDWHYPNAVRP